MRVILTLFFIFILSIISGAEVPFTHPCDGYKWPSGLPVFESLPKDPPGRFILLSSPDLRTRVRTLYEFNGREFKILRSESFDTRTFAIRIDVGCKRFDPYGLESSLSSFEINFKRSVMSDVFVERSDKKHYRPYTLKVEKAGFFSVFVYDDESSFGEKVFRGKDGDDPGAEVYVKCEFANNVPSDLKAKVENFLKSGHALDVSPVDTDGKRVSIVDLLRMRKRFNELSHRERLLVIDRALSRDYMDMWIYSELVSKKIELLYALGRDVEARKLSDEALNETMTFTQAYTNLRISLLRHSTDEDLAGEIGSIIRDTEVDPETRITFLYLPWETKLDHEQRVITMEICRSLLLEDAFPPALRLMIIERFVNDCALAEGAFDASRKIISNELSRCPSASENRDSLLKLISEVEQAASEAKKE